VKRVGLLFASTALALFLAGGVALALVINGTAGDDTLTGRAKSDFIYGYEGNDTIYGKGGNDEMWGGFGSDVIRGHGGNDTLHGEGGADTVSGGSEDDELRGADGRDILNGGDGNDRLYDRSGDTAERDRFNCGPGEDMVRSDPTDIVDTTTCETVNADGGADLLPDLGMKQLAQIQIEDTGTQKRLRFNTTIVNVGAGPFEATGRRPDTNTTDMTSTQRIYDSTNDYRDRSTAATFFYSGDGHEHWHVRNLEKYELFRLNGDGTVSDLVGTGAKNGFCFYDNHNWGSLEPEYYRGCENGNPSALKVTMGLSRGWGDTYQATLPTQYIDITGLPDGRYRLQVEADEAGLFLESDETNNLTWADLQITGNTVTVLQYGPSAPPVS
jgi:hypothetical protein